MEEGREKGHGVARWFRSRGTITWMNLAAGITLGFLIGLYVGDTSQWWLLIVAALFALYVSHQSESLARQQPMGCGRRSHHRSERRQFEELGESLSA